VIVHEKVEARFKVLARPETHRSKYTACARDDRGPL